MDSTGLEEKGAADIVRVCEVPHTGDVTGLEVHVSKHGLYCAYKSLISF